MATERELKTFYTDDKHVVIEVDCKIDISSAETLAVLVQNEAGIVTSHAATVSPGETNKIRFSKALTDFNTEGIYIARPKITFDSTHIQQGKADRFRVKESWSVT